MTGKQYESIWGSLRGHHGREPMKLSHLEFARAIEAAAIAAYKAEVISKGAVVSLLPATEEYADAFAHGYFCGEDEARAPLLERIAALEAEVTRFRTDALSEKIVRMELERLAAKKDDCVAALEAKLAQRVPDGGHPMQPVVIARDKVHRFLENKMVNHLYEWARDRGMGLNEMAAMGFSDEDRMQFAQLIGYSASGYGGLSFVTAKSAEEADRRSAMLSAAPAAPEQQEPTADGDDPRVQAVYELLCADDSPPNRDEHWEGYRARQIVDALFPVAQAPNAQQAEPPPWWPAVENILNEYGLQAFDFVADFKKAQQAEAQEPCAYIRRDQLQKAAQAAHLCEVTPEPRQDRVAIFTRPQPEKYDQQALELCESCGWKAVVPTEGCLNCTRVRPAQLEKEPK